MQIQRREFRYKWAQEDYLIQVTDTSLLVQQPGEILFRVQDCVFEEGLFQKRKIVIPQYRRQNFDEVMQQVADFINSVGKENLVNVCETFANQYLAGDLRVRIWVVWYWQAE